MSEGRKLFRGDFADSTQGAFLAVVLSATIAGFGGIFIKHISMSATSIAFMRTGIATAFTFFVIRSQGLRLFHTSPFKMATISVFNSLRMWLFLVAFIETSIGNAIILFYSWPIFVAFLGRALLRERFERSEAVLLFMAFTGLIVAYSAKEFSFDDRDFVGMLAALGSSLIYAFVVVGFKSESAAYTRNELVFYQNFSGAFIFLPFFILDFDQATQANLRIGFFYAVVIGILGYNLFFHGLKKLRASLASALMYIEVVSAIVLGYLWFGEVLHPTMIIGGAMILLSSFLLNQRAK